MKLLVTAAAILLMTTPRSALPDGPGVPVAKKYTYTINLTTKPASSGWELVYIDGDFYFMGLRKRRPDDTAKPWKNKGICRLYDLAADEGNTTIRVKGCEDYAGEYLSGDYTTMPPSVKLEKEPGKFTTWNVHREGKGEAYVENVNVPVKAEWLSKDDKVSALVPSGPDLVTEFRRAVLSTDSKPAIRVHKSADDDD